MNKKIYDKIAENLFIARKNRVPINPLTIDFPEITCLDAYQIQSINIEREVKSGAKIVGKKIGLTSKAMQELLGVNEPDYGVILDNMILDDSGNYNLDNLNLIQSKIEAEIAFVLKKDVRGPGITIIKVLQSTEYVLPVLEIVDTRIKNWKIKIQDTVADNASSAYVVLGGNVNSIENSNLCYTPLILKKNGKIQNTGVGANVLGHPAFAVAWLANKLSKYQMGLKEGEVILAGALTAAVSISKGDCITADFGNFGSVGVSFD